MHRIEAEADTCFKQSHPLTVEPLQTCLTTDCWRFGVCRGNNNNLKISLLLHFTLLLCVPPSVSPSLPSSLLGFISSPGQCPSVRSWCDLCHRLWSQLISLLSQFSQSFPPLLLPPSPTPWLPYTEAVSISASLAPAVGTGRRASGGEKLLYR